MNGKRILVTGGAGYIGSHINKALNRRGYETVVFDSLENGHIEAVKWGAFEKGDLRDAARLREVFEKHAIGGVMHFASYIQVGESMTEPEKYYYNNLAYTLNLLKVMKERGVKAFIFSSTAAVYGNPVQVPIPEDHPLAPINPYGASKFMVERLLDDYDRAYGLKSVRLRYFNAAGADPETEIGEWHLPETHLIPLILDAAMGRRASIKIFGDDYDTPDGTCLRDYIHVEDLAEAHILALEYLLNGGETQVFNLGNGTGFSVRKVIEVVEKVTGLEVPRETAPRREGDPAVLIAGSGKAQKVLGWAPKRFELETIVADAWAWHRKLWGGEK